MLRELLVLLALTSVTLAALYRETLPPKPCKYQDVDGCYIRQLDEVVPFGEARASRTACEEYRCTEKEIVTATCGAYADPKPPSDPTKPYPDCCPST